MAELKTLKDFRTTQKFETPTAVVELVSTDDLRQEAIKWAKSLETIRLTKYGEANGIIKWIKHFFGISEEDLKAV